MPTVTSQNKAAFDEEFYETRKDRHPKPKKSDEVPSLPSPDMGEWMKRYEAHKKEGRHFHNLLRMAALHGDSAAHDSIMDLYEKYEYMESVPKSAKKTLQGFHDVWYPKIEKMT
jgi:hypothetical protein